jgi:hypothetical protein
MKVPANIGLDPKDSVMGVYCKAVQDRIKLSWSWHRGKIGKSTLHPRFIQELNDDFASVNQF